MIHARELTKGRKVLFVPQGNRKHAVKSRICTVKELHDKTVLVDDGGLSLSLFYDSEDLQPIPLTPDILIAAGFTNAPFNSMFIYLNKHKHDCDKIDFSFNDNFCRVEFVGRRPTPGLLKHLQYLHQLQNLYFALTGTELTINL